MALGAYSATSLNYEYIVIGSGAGGGPAAARLAMAGHKTLLIEAGDDQGANVNYTVPAYQAKSTEDPLLDWSFYVRHYADDARQERDYKLTYTLPDGSEYTGLNPPAGAKIKGVLYPRSATLGGCTAHNALVTIYPDESDFQYIADLTGDQSWKPDNVRNYWTKLEKNNYLPPGTPGHGFLGWLGVSLAPITLAVQDLQLFGMITGAVAALGNGSSILPNFLNVLTGDANADTVIRDQNQALYQIPIATDHNARNGAREFVLQVANAKDALGNKQYPLDVRLNCYVTKVTFDKTQSPPKANGVEFLDGKHLYRASPLSSQAAPGTPGNASASREVIVAGGSYNSPQILKLSGIGPKAELESFGIEVISDLPGVGTNLQDHYEVVVQAQMAKDFPVLNGCNFGFAADGVPIPATDDPCYNQWNSAGPYGYRGVYSSSGFAAGMFVKTTDSPDNNYDLLAFGGPVNFRGYFPGYSYNATYRHDYFSWAILKSHPRNTAGTVKLKSADPLDTPDILFNYFDTGVGDYNADLEQIYEAIETSRNAIADQPTGYTEILPGAQAKTKDDIFQYIKDTAWGHHCSCTCPIGADNDPMAVLDSSFRVRGVQGLRVADASVYPRIPGTFTAASTYLVGEKAADVILSQLKK
ncbi:hypothetical protein AMS68_000162 [Peltaster fructicola]|uniref:Glucose-methanol-choline oxidoreductase N-terminal domain-containing protein n=1 Tax=Peltaster fructicola TaxID=286661 RepID=A0A6H0XJ41_9PEZI|nr:hypothetical protein AMS68_000162 [Peltaster fructicola]